MADSWEDEADEVASATAPVVALTVPLTDKWEGEDEDDVPDAWDAEEEKKPSTTSETTKEAAAKKSDGDKTKPKKRSKQLAAAADKKRLEAEEKRRQAAGEAASKSPEEAGGEAATNLTPEELRRIQEEADLLVAKDTFGVDEAVPAHAIDPQKSIDLIQPVTKSDYDALSRLLSQKLRQFETSPHYPAFVESTFRECSLELDSESLRKLSVMFSALATEKQKLQKPSGKGKKKGKGVVKVERDAASAAPGEDYDDYDDYDDFI